MSYRVFLSPSDQRANTYAAGGTTEDVQCGRIAQAAKAALERCGIDVLLVHYESMASKCTKSDNFNADLHVPIHTNAYNGAVGGTRILVSNMSGEGAKASQSILKYLGPLTPGNTDQVQAYPTLYEIRVPKAPTAYIEADFHDVPEISAWIIDNTEAIGEAICKGICDYFNVSYVEVQKEEPEVRYQTLGDIKKDEYNGPFYLPTIEKLIAAGVLTGKGGEGDDKIIDLGEDAVRLLVILDRSGVFE